MNKTKKRRKTQRRRRKQMRGGSIEIGSLTSGTKGTFEFEMMNIEDLYYNRKAYEDYIHRFGCSFLDSSDIAVIIDSYLDTKDYALDSGIYRYKDNTRHNKVFFLYFIDSYGGKHMIGFISCSIYTPRNICYVNWECSAAEVIKTLVDIGDRRVERASHVLQAFLINYLARMGVTAIYKQLRTYDHPQNEYGDTRIPRYDIMLYNLDTGFQLYKRRQEQDRADLAFLDLRNDHYSRFDINQFNGVHPTRSDQSSYYTGLNELVEMLRDARQYESAKIVVEIDNKIDLLNRDYSHIKQLMYMRDLCNMLNMTESPLLFSFGKPKPKEETITPSKKAEKRLDLKAQSLVSNRKSK